MSFKSFRDELRVHFGEMIEGQDRLFVSSLSGDELWEIYLESFRPEDNEIFRERRYHDCGCCRNFIRQMGNVVAIENATLKTMWDFEPSDEVYKPVALAMRSALADAYNRDLFVTKQGGYGKLEDFEQLEEYVHTWNHFRLDIPPRLLNRTRETNETIAAQYRQLRNLLVRGMDEISPQAIADVLDMIDEGVLYRGSQWRSQLEEFAALQAAYRQIESCLVKADYALEMTGKVSPVVAGIRNTSMGTLLVDLSEGMDAEEAVRRYEKVVAPENYRRPKPVFTQRMLEEAQKMLDELDLTPALRRRHARIGDLWPEDVVWANKTAQRKMGHPGSGILVEMLSDDISSKQATPPKDAPTIGIDEFIRSLEGVRDIEVFFEKRHVPHMVSLIAPDNPARGKLFSWGNNFSWIYSGNLGDATFAEDVRKAGGLVDGAKMRFSLRWNVKSESHSDLDAHCITPGGREIYYGHKRVDNGVLDVDIINPRVGVPAIENIAWGKGAGLRQGKYVFLVKCFTRRFGENGFEAQLAAGDKVYDFEYPRAMNNKQVISVCEVTVTPSGDMLVKPFMEAKTNFVDENAWDGARTGQYYPVSAIMYSPNYWEGASKTGHKHYMFMLPDFVSKESLSGFLNEHLHPDLRPHRRVFEALSNKLRVEPTPAQLSGIGFSETRRNSLSVKVNGRPFTIIF